MAQYIDKDAVVAEIQGYISGYKDILSKVDEKCLKYAEGIEAKIDILQHLLSFLETLEVKENDLVEELDYDDYMTFFKEHPDYIDGSWGFEETWTFGQYCYTLGLKAQKGE